MNCKIDGPQIKTLRESRGISRNQLAKLVRRTPGTLWAWETGNATKTNDVTVEALARALGVSPYDVSSDYMPPRDPLLGRVYFDQDLARRTMGKRRMTYRDLAAKTGIPTMTVYYILNTDKPSADTEQVYVLALALGLKPGDLSPLLATIPGVGDREVWELARTL